MNVDDFVKLPPEHAVELYLKYRDAGDLEKSSELHRAYSNERGVSLAKYAVETAPQRNGVRLGAEAISAIARISRDTTKSWFNSWKVCDYCQSRIKTGAVVCRYCQRDLPTKEHHD